MNKLILTLIGICLSIFSLGQTTENNKLIELGKAYKNFMFSNEPPMGFVNMLQLNMPEDLNVTASFSSNYYNRQRPFKAKVPRSSRQPGIEIYLHHSCN